MPTGLSATTATAILNALCNGTAFNVASVFAKLHVGDPGAAGTANPAANTTRMAISFGTAASGACSNDAAQTWASVPATEDYTHISLWDAVSAGTFLCSGTITANAVTTGDDFTLPVGDIDLTFPVAS